MGVWGGNSKSGTTASSFSHPAQRLTACLVINSGQAASAETALPAKPPDLSSLPATLEVGFRVARRPLHRAALASSRGSLPPAGRDLAKEAGMAAAGTRLPGQSTFARPGQATEQIEGFAEAASGGPASGTAGLLEAEAPEGADQAIFHSGGTATAEATTCSSPPAAPPAGVVYPALRPRD